mmetsp:Transcript_59868/g.177453  ORF Transcript_59868/g.177453 Transcript_59868/m.177453 type:complete len:286 (+) Transcript_59868:1205-2062(+)
MAPFDRIVAIPPRASPNIAKIGDLAKPSSLFNSLVVITKILRTQMKYHNKGKNATSVKGRTVIAVTNAPRQMKAHTKKSNRVVGRRSSLLPTSALNLFNILPRGLVSKKEHLALNTDAVIWSCSAREALIVNAKLPNARTSARITTPAPRPITMPIIDAVFCFSGGCSDQIPSTAIVPSTLACVTEKANNRNNATVSPPMARAYVINVSILTTPCAFISSLSFEDFAFVVPKLSVNLFSKFPVDSVRVVEVSLPLASMASFECSSSSALWADFVNFPPDALTHSA